MSEAPLLAFLYDSLSDMRPGCNALHPDLGQLQTTAIITSVLYLWLTGTPILLGKGTSGFAQASLC
ncbi:hypothetical protein ES703_116478 [subsurface metagenome]